MAQAGKNEGGAGMDKGGLRRMLKLAIKQPIHAAFAIGADGKAVVHLDKAKQPRALVKVIKESTPEAKEHRFGSVSVDPDDPKLARFMVNKAGAGLGKKLIKALKGTGFSKVIIVLEDGSEVEKAEGDEDEEEDRGHDDKDASDDDDQEIETGGHHHRKLTKGEEEGEGEGDEPDAGELTRTLTGLVKRMIGVIAKDPTKKAALAELATDAQASLKRGDLEQAAAGIDILRQALGGGADGADRGGKAHASDEVEADEDSASDEDQDEEQGKGRGRHAAEEDDADQDGGHEHGMGVEMPEHDEAKHHKHRAQKAHKSRTAWLATRSKIEADIKKLKAEILKATKDEDMGADLEKHFHSAVEPVLATLDEKLAHVLEAAAKAEAREEHAKLMAEAHKVIEHYRGFVSSNQVILHLDSNPFMPLQVGKVLSTTLNTLASALR